MTWESAGPWLRSLENQVECGLDVINDGEQGKIDYTAYVTDRLTGFDDDSVPATDPFAGLNPQDTEEFPEYAAMMRQFTSPFQKRPACTGPITWKDWPAVGKEIANLKTATSGTKAGGGLHDLRLAGPDCPIPEEPVLSQ